MWSFTKEQINVARKVSDMLQLTDMGGIKLWQNM